jgi:hypothetical protein
LIALRKTNGAAGIRIRDKINLMITTINDKINITIIN